MCGSAMSQDLLLSTVICSSSSTWHCCRLWALFLPSKPGKWRYLSSTTQSLLQHWSTFQASSLWCWSLSHFLFGATLTSAMEFSLEGLCCLQLSFLFSCLYPRYGVHLYIFAGTFKHNRFQKSPTVYSRCVSCFNTIASLCSYHLNYGQLQSSMFSH